MKFKVQFFKCTKQQYETIIPDSYSFYFLLDTGQVFLGSIQLSNADFTTLYNSIMQLTRDLNSLEQNSAKVIVVTENNKTSIQQSRSEQHTFYVYYYRQELNGPDIKIGDGTTPVSSLPFLSQGSVLLFTQLQARLQEHINDRDKHIRTGTFLDSQGNPTTLTSERQKWNNKVNCYTTKINQSNEQEISTNEIKMLDNSNDFHLYFKSDNENLVINNLLKNIRIN